MGWTDTIHVGADFPGPEVQLPSVPLGQRKGVAERVFTHILAGSSMYGGYPGGWSANRWEQVRHFRFWSYIAISCRMVEMAKHPPQAGFVVPGDRPRGFQRHLRDRRHEKTLHAVRPHEEVELVEPDHPLQRLLDQPNAWDTAGWADLVSELEMYLCLTGNAYLWVVPNGLGVPCELFVVPSHWVSARYDRREPTGVHHYDVIPYPGSAYMFLPADEVIHLRTKNPLHKIDGYATQSAIAEEIDAAESIMKCRFWMFRNWAAPMGAIELGEDYHDPDDVDVERIYGKVFARLQGETNYGRPLVLPPGAKFTPLRITPNEMDFVASADQLRDYILTGWRVPKEVAGIQDAGSEIAMYGPLRQFAERVIAPQLSYYGSVLTQCLAKRFHPDLRLWFDDPTPESPDQRNKDIDLQAKWSATTPNEIRAKFGLEPFEHGGDDPVSPRGLTILPLNTGQDLSQLDEMAAGGGSSSSSNLPGQQGGGGNGQTSKPTPGAPKSRKPRRKKSVLEELMRPRGNGHGG